jgi:hypothetical protein
MPFLGRQPAVGFASIAKDDFTADGSTTAFTLSRVASNANDIAVFVGNVRQEPTDAYSVSGTTLTMTAAPSSGTNFYVLHLAGGIQSSTVPAAGTTVPGAFGASGTISTTSNLISITNSSYPQLQINSDTKNWVIFNDPSGRLYFKNSSDNVNAIQIEADGDTRFVGGISFDNGSNYLDDYEEGTFTPVIDIENGGTVSGTKYGHYVKVGNMVTVNFGVPVTGTSGASSGNALQFSNMPFASRDQNGSGHPLAIRIQSASVQTYHWMGQLFPNATNGRIEGSTNGTDLSNSSTYIGNGTDIKITITYITD